MMEATNMEPPEDDSKDNSLSTDQSVTSADEARLTIPDDDDIAKQQNSSDTFDKPLSKNQLKKQKRHEKWLVRRSERRKVEREKRKQKRKQMSAECATEGFGPPVNKIRKMDDPEDVKKLVKQLQRCYAENRRVEKPLQYYVCSFKDKTKEVFDSSIQGYKQWDVNFEGLDPESKFGKDKLVFLAAESPNVLQNLDPQKVYIIGGLVDHNHHKGVCFQYALDRGWEHAQLPIGDNIQMKSRKVLAVNHVFEILLQFVQCNDWLQTISKVIPLRKQVIEQEESQSDLTKNKEVAEKQEKSQSDETKNKEVTETQEESQLDQLNNRGVLATDKELSDIPGDVLNSAADSRAVGIPEESDVVKSLTGHESKDLKSDPAEEPNGGDVEDGS
ncbi:tRNA methyltransferase 10 homolog A-like isoform X2 [Anneissia japonica]|uniref:tRNA methyltransferase 10 homolog A-like isoform X2 n=1 Tax=Anneissia japonica TaxID=1529436 RepID=UPI001425B031|nr:tRNA methyltransferase 10 homolog A-like isoform X2 [Anneissia japonica]